jgi:hypothetical protein
MDHLFKFIVFPPGTPHAQADLSEDEAIDADGLWRLAQLRIDNEDTSSSKDALTNVPQSRSYFLTMKKSSIQISATSRRSWVSETPESEPRAGNAQLPISLEYDDDISEDNNGSSDGYRTEYEDEYQDEIEEYDKDGVGLEGGVVETAPKADAKNQRASLRKSNQEAFKTPKPPPQFRCRDCNMGFVEQSSQNLALSVPNAGSAVFHPEGLFNILAAAIA